MQVSEILLILYPISFATLFSINIYSLIKINKLKKMIKYLLTKFEDKKDKNIQVELEKIKNKSKILPITYEKDELFLNVVDLNENKKFEKPINIDIENIKKDNSNNQINVNTIKNKGFFRKFFKL